MYYLRQLLTPVNQTGYYSCYYHKKSTQFKKNIYLLSFFDFLSVGISRVIALKPPPVKTCRFYSSFLLSMRKRLPLIVAIIPLDRLIQAGLKRNKASTGTGIVVVTNKIAVTIRHCLTKKSLL